MTDSKEPADDSDVPQASTDVLLTFDLDALSAWLEEPWFTPTNASRGELDAHVLPAILRTLASGNVAATFFVPGHTALTYPPLIKQLVEVGHEVALHGFRHVRPIDLSSEEEAAELGRGVDAIHRTCGLVPRGYRSPGWANSDRTIRLLSERGFSYDSSLMGRHGQAYWARIGDHNTLDHGYVFGQDSNVVEIPVSWHLDDVPHLEYVTHGLSLVSPGLQDPQALAAIWLDELRFAAAYDDIAFLNLTMHPGIVGRGARLRVLEALVDEIVNNPALRSARCLDVAERWRTDQSA